MKVREIKDIERAKCPIDIVFGNSRYWGAFFHPKKKYPATFIRMMVKGITYGVFYDTLYHEIFHQVLYPLKKQARFNHKEEHWIIDRLLNYQYDWY